MIDLHTHSLLSDGVLLPAEIARRYEVAGYKAVAITDHVDTSNIDEVIPELVRFVDEFNRTNSGIVMLAGAELTHVSLKQIPILVKKARELGASLVLVHGQTLAEPVVPGTNLVALENDIDILTHPGLITTEEAKIAAKKGICLEISARKGHCWTNGHVAQVALRTGANLVVNTDSHQPGDLITPSQAEKIGYGAGLSETEVKRLVFNAQRLVKARTRINISI